MGVENCGWRVIGIAPKRSSYSPIMDFRKQSSPATVSRACGRSNSNRPDAVCAREAAEARRRFFETFLANDCTVIMLVEQNRGKSSFPRYLAHRQPDADFSERGTHRLEARRRCATSWQCYTPISRSGTALQSDYGRSPDKPVRMAKRHADPLSKKPAKGWRQRRGETQRSKWNVSVNREPRRYCTTYITGLTLPAGWPPQQYAIAS